MSKIALALIEQFVRLGYLDADDIQEMCAELSEIDRNRVLAAWVMGAVPDSRQEPEKPKPSLSLLSGGKLEP